MEAGMTNQETIMAKMEYQLTLLTQVKMKKTVKKIKCYLMNRQSMTKSKINQKKMSIKNSMEDLDLIQIKRMKRMKQ